MPSPAISRRLCIAAHRAPRESTRLIAHAVVVALCAGFFLHVVPGFNNPRVIDAVLIGDGVSSYTKYLNFDKGITGVLLLGLYVPERVRNDEAARRFAAFAWRGGERGSLLHFLVTPDPLLNP